MPKFDRSEQGTPEWHKARAGHATASKFYAILAGGKTRETYLYEVLAERMSGEAKRNTSSKSLEWGTESEPLARQEYEVITGELVKVVGFAFHSKIKYAGASSDALVGDKGCLEIKAPFNSGVHIRTWALGMPEDHKPQVQGNLWILEREWIDFCSYDPAYDRPLNLYIERFHRHQKYIDMLEREVTQFLAEVKYLQKTISKKIDERKIA